MTCRCRTGARCLPCIERDGLTRHSLVRRVHLTIPNIEGMFRRAGRCPEKRLEPPWLRVTRNLLPRNFSTTTLGRTRWVVKSRP